VGSEGERPLGSDEVLGGAYHLISGGEIGKDFSSGWGRRANAMREEGACLFRKRSTKKIRKMKDFRIPHSRRHSSPKEGQGKKSPTEGPLESNQIRSPEIGKTVKPSHIDKQSTLKFLDRKATKAEAG